MGIPKETATTLKEAEWIPTPKISFLIQIAIRLIMKIIKNAIAK
jgi:hypothetical protein